MINRNTSGSPLATSRIRTRSALGAAGLTIAFAALAIVAGAQNAVPSLPALMPRDADAIASVQSDWLWKTSESIRHAPGPAAAIAQFEQTTGLSFETDILPWSGQVGMAAILTMDKNPQYVSYFEIRDTGKFMAMLAKVQGRIQSPSPGAFAPKFQPRDYHGTTVYDLATPPGAKLPRVSFAILNGWAVSAYGSGAIEHALDVYQGRFPSVQSTATWSTVLDKLPRNAQAWAACDLSTAVSSVPAAKSPGNATLLDLSKICYGGALTDEGNGLRLDFSLGADTRLGQAIDAQFGRNLPPVSGRILNKVPDSVFVTMFTNPAYIWSAMKPVLIGVQKTAKERRDVAHVLNQPSLTSTVPYFRKDVGLAVTWRKDRGFGLVLLGQAESHAAALHTAKVIANGFKQMGVPLAQGGSSWSAEMPGLQMMVPPTVPVKLAPFMSAKDSWLIIGTNPSWAVPSSTPALSMPPGSSSSQSVSILSMRWLPTLYSIVEQQAPADNTDVQQSLALARGLHLESSTWSAVSRYDIPGRSFIGTIRVSNWDWRTALDNTVTAVENWKPSTQPGKGRDLLKNRPDMTQSAQPHPNAG